MALTQIEQLLIGFLETSKAGEPEKTLAFLAVDTEPQMLKLCRFLSDNENASGEQILQEARRIAAE